MRNLRFHPDCLKELKSMPAKHFKQIITKIFQMLKDPMQNDTRKLTGQSDLYRVSQGEYRIIYSFDDKNLFIEIIGSRNDDQVYKALDRKF